eukprot:5937986-Pyramimonas_sp.AAC.1
MKPTVLVLLNSVLNAEGVVVFWLWQSEHKRINTHIRKAILDADKSGSRVCGLGALNKAEFLNRGGAIFVEEMPDLKVSPDEKGAPL